MRRFIQYLATFLVFFIIADGAIAQSTTITGNVRSATEKAGIAAVSVSVKGTSQGTFTNDKGNFSITVTQPLPVTLVFSAVGTTTQEVVVSSVSTALIAWRDTPTLFPNSICDQLRSARRTLSRFFTDGAESRRRLLRRR